MSTSSSSSQSNLNKIQDKISQLSSIKQQYVMYMLKLSQIKNTEITEYVCNLIKFLIFSINIKNNNVLKELNVCFTYLMTTYVFDIDELIHGSTDMTKYSARFQNLITINKNIEFHVENENSFYLQEFKENLLKV